MEQINLDINGKEIQVGIEKNWTLLFVLREALGLTGAKCGCSTGDCGACEVVTDGGAVNSCLVLAWNLEGKKIETIEGLSNGMNLHPIQQAFIDVGATQCGYYTSGTVMSVRALLDRTENPTEGEIRNNGISSNLCRCTEYVKIVEAIKLAIRRTMEAKTGGKKEER